MKKSLFLSIALLVSISPSVILCANTKASAPVNQQIDPLVFAAAQGSEEQIKALVGDTKLKYSEQNKVEALAIAIACQNKETVRSLLDLGADPNANIGPANQSYESWATIESLGCLLRAANAVDAKQDGMALERGKDGNVITRTIPKTDTQRAQELARAKEIFELVIGHSKTDLCKKNAAGLDIYTLIQISKAASPHVGGEATVVVNQTIEYIVKKLESELINRKIDPTKLVQEIPAQISRQLKEIEAQNKTKDVKRK